MLLRFFAKPQYVTLQPGMATLGHVNVCHKPESDQFRHMHNNIIMPCNALGH